jgi:hypothetical protein
MCSRLSLRKAASKAARKRMAANDVNWPMAKIMQRLSANQPMAFKRWRMASAAKGGMAKSNMANQ